MKKGPHKMMLESNRYDKWERDRGGGAGSGGAGVTGGSGGGGVSGAWAGRDRERDRERERQARAHQMSLAHAAEPDAFPHFPAPIRGTGSRDRVSQQIQIKLGDYHLAQTLLDDPSKSIGICAEPPSPCPPSRRESEFKKPSQAPAINGRVHHRPYVHNKSDVSGSGTTAHRPPPLRIPNGFPSQNTIDSSNQPPIESILKEMKSLPTPLSVIAATPRKELENKFIFNDHTNRVQENPQLVNNDIKTALPKPGLENRITNSRTLDSPDVVHKDLGLSESDDEVPATTTRLEPILSPIGSGCSPSSASETSPSDSESESSSAESSAPVPPTQSPAPAPAPAPASVVAVSASTPSLAPTLAPQPAQRSSWSLSNFAPPPAHPPEQTYDSGKELRHALADVKGKPSPMSDSSDSDTSLPSPSAIRRRRSVPKRVPTASSDEETSRPQNTQSSPRMSSVMTAAPLKRGRPPKSRGSDERPPKKKRGRPRKPRASSPAPAPAPPPPPSPSPPPEHHQLQETKTHIFRKVFTPKKGDECGGKGGKGGKGKGGKGKGKGQVTIIEITAPESGADDDDRRDRDHSSERRNEEAIARVSPPQEPETLTRRREADRVAHERIQERVSIERTDHRDRLQERQTTEWTSNDRIPSDRLSERLNSDRGTVNDRYSSNDRLSMDRVMGSLSSDRLSIERQSLDKSSRLSGEKVPFERMSGDKSSHERFSMDKMTYDRLSSDKNSIDRPSDKVSAERLTNDKMLQERLPGDKISLERIPSDKITHERHSSNKLQQERSGNEKTLLKRMPVDRIIEERTDKSAEKILSREKLGHDRVPCNKLMEHAERVERVASDRYVRAEADVGSGIKTGRGSERLEEVPFNVSERRVRPKMLVQLPLSRLRPETVRALQRPPQRRQPTKRPASPPPEPMCEVVETNHERTGGSGQTPIYYSYFERLPADALSDEEKDHQYYLAEAKRLRMAAEQEQEPLPRVMRYLESVLCFVLTGRVLELELDTKQAFMIYRETIEYIKSIHSMPQRFRASPHSTFSKLDILSMRVQALLYRRMFKMYTREVKEYNKIVQEYQQKPAGPESVSSVSSVSPLSPSPSPAGSVGSVGSAASSGYCSMVHSVPAHAHHALLQLTKYYTFLYVAHDLWEHADSLCRLRPNKDLFIAVDRKCGPLTLSSTFKHLVQYVRYAISLLKNEPRE